MSDFIERLNKEASELQDKYTKLGNFIDTDKFKELNPDEQALLKLQYRQMLPYLNTLKQRVNFYTEDLPEVEEEQLELDLNNEDNPNE